MNRLCRNFMKRPILATLALILALALPVCALPSLLARASDEADQIVQYEDDFEDGGEDGANIEAYNIDYNGGIDIGADMAALNLGYSGDEDAANDEDIELDNEDSNEDADDVEDENYATPGNTDGGEDEAEEEAEQEQPQVITITAFAELDEEIMYQGFPLPGEGGEPVIVDDVNFPESLEATDTDDNSVEITGVTWVCPDYDFTVMGAYVFTPKLPDGYVVSEDVDLPEITVYIVGDVGIAPLLIEQTVTTFADLQTQIAAYASANDNMVISIGDVSKITIDAPLTIPANSGYTLTIKSASSPKLLLRNTNGDLFTVSGNASLILQDIIINGDSDSPMWASNTGSLVRVESNGKLEMNDGVVLQNNNADKGAGVYINYGTFTMNGGEISDNTTSSNGGGVYVNWGNFTMSGGKINGNTTTDGTGGGVYVLAGTFNMSGGEIINNTATYSGGGVYFQNNTFTMTGGEISGNKCGSAYKGGGVYVSTGTFTLGGSAKIYDNYKGSSTTDKSNVYLSSGCYITLSSPASGMNVYVTTATESGLVVSSGADETIAGYFRADLSGQEVILQNDQLIIRAVTPLEIFLRQVASYATATENTTIALTEDITLTANVTIPANAGGYTLTITSADAANPCTIFRGFTETISSNGLIMFSANSSLILKDVIIDGQQGTHITNAAPLVSMNASTAKLEMQDGAVLKNNRGFYGGGLNFPATGAGEFIMTGGEISDNTSTGSGGGVAYQGGKFTMTGGTISGNTSATTGGGVYVVNGVTFTMTGGEISGNTATTNGSGVYAHSTSTLKLNLGGDAKIYDNYKGSGTTNKNNVYLADGKYITLSTSTAPATNMNIYVTTATASGVIVDTGASESVAGYFHADTDTKYVAYQLNVSVGQLVIIDKATPAITFDFDSAEAIAGNTVTLAASSSTDAEITFTSSNTDIATISGNSVTFLKAGTVTLTASQAATDNYNAATATQEVTVTLPATVTTFAQLKAAIASYANATAANTDIIIGASFTIDELLTIPANSGKTLTIKSADDAAEPYTLTRKSGVTGNLFTVSANAHLILQNIIIDGGRTGDSTTSKGGSLVKVNASTAKFTMNDGATLQNNAYAGNGGGVYNGGTFTMTGGTISDIYATYNGAGVYSSSGTFIMTGGEIIRTTTGASGGGLSISGGTFTMTGGTISGNYCGSSSSNGGGVSVSNNGTLTLGGNAKIYDNYKGSDTTDKSNVYLTDGKYITLSSPASGMNVYVQTASTDGKIVDSGATDTIAGYFHADESTKSVLQLGGKLYVQSALDFFYTQVAAYATATSNMEITVSGDLTLTSLVTIPTNVTNQAAGNTAITLTIKSADAESPRTLLRGINGDLFTVSANASLILQNIIIDGGRTSSSDTTSKGGSLVLVDASTAKFTMNSGATLQNNVHYQGVGVFNNGGTFNMNGGAISGNATTNSGAGGGVYNYSGTFNMSGDAAISTNTATSSGGGVYIRVGTFNMSGTATISNNTTANSGGGVYNSGGTFTMSGGTIGGTGAGNTATTNGGGVSVSTNGTLTLGGTAKIYDNYKGSNTTDKNNVYLPNGKYITLSSPASGMNVYVQTASTDGKIVDSGATDGVAGYFHADDSTKSVLQLNGKLYVQSAMDFFYTQVAAYATATENMTITVSGDLTLTSLVTIPTNVTNQAAGNTAITLTIQSASSTDIKTLTRGADGNLFTVSSGASLILEKIIIDGQGNVNIQGGTFTSNTGSLANISSGGKLEMRIGAVLQNNKATIGGGVYVDSSGTFTMSDGTISSNIVTTNSGGVYVNSSGTFTMSSGTISNNTATTNGGGVNVSRGAFIMNGGTISDNTASGYGGGVCLVNTGTFNMSGGTISSNTTPTNGGSGVYVYSGGKFQLNSKPIIEDGVYTVDALSSGITITGDLTTGAKIVIEGSSNATDQMQAGVQVTGTYTGLTDAMANMFVSKNDVDGNPGLVGTKSGSYVVWRSSTLTATDITRDLTAKTYNGTAQALPSATAYGGGTVTLYYNNSTTAPTNAGTYAITASVTASGDFKAATGLELGTYTINTKAVTVTPDASQSKTYGAADPTFTYTANDASAAFTGALSRVTGENAGTYAYAMGTLSAGGNYTLSLGGSNTFAITAKALTITGAAHTKVYDGGTTATGVTVTLNGIKSGDDVAAGTVTAEYTAAAAGTTTINISAVALTGTESGNYTVTSANSVTVAGITKKPLTNAMITGDIVAATYTGLAQTPTPAVADGSILNSCDYTWSYSNNTNAGTATATITATESGNYSGSASKEFTIAKATLTVTADDKTITYGEAAPSYTVTYSDFVNSETVSVLTGAPAISCNYAQGDGVQKYYIYPTIGTLAAANYNFKFEQGTLHVEKRDLSSVTVAAITAVTYSGAAHTPVPSVSDGTIVIASTDYTVSYTNNTNAGTATVTLTATNGGNYKNTKTATFTISPLNLSTAGATAQQKYQQRYRGVIIDAAIEVKRGGTNLDARTDYTLSGHQQRNAGTYTATVTGTGNYTGTISNVSFTIRKKSLLVVAEDKSVSYNAAAPSYTATYEGFARGDGVSVLSGTPAFSCLYTKGNATGYYMITPNGLSAANYDIYYVKGTLKVG